MKTIELTNDTRPEGDSVATIGFFDGVHRGHQWLIRQVVDEARRTGRQSLAVTFDRHPREVLCPGQPPRLLTTLDEKLLLLSRTGVDAVVVLPFSRAMAALSARDFMQHVLLGQLGVRTLITGYDNRFGHNRSEGFDDYAAYGRTMGMDVVRAEPLDVDGTRVSSSVVRQMVAAGDVAAAHRLLGHPYTLTGTVAHGHEEGRRMGFPTANLAPDAPLLIPRPGVYAVRVRREGQVAWEQGMMNIGTRPTFDGHHVTLETHILHYKGNLYGTRLSVAFAARLRDERRFASPDELARQLRDDRQQTEQILNNYGE